MARRSDIDWEALERDYRLGTVSIAAVAKNHGVAVSGLKRKAKEKGWTRDLTPVVQAATKAAITSERANYAKELADKAPEIGREIGRSISQAANSGLDQDVAAAAALGTMRNRVHADIASAILDAGMSMLAEVKALADPLEVAILEQAIDQDDEYAQKKLKQAISLTERSRTLDTIAAAVNKAVGVDRKANNLDDKDVSLGKSIEDKLDEIREQL